jgi:hypothetical protein
MPRGDVIDTGLNVTLQPNPSGLYFTGDNKLGFNGQGNNITVIGSGANASLRPLQDKLQDYVTTSDYSSVQAAVDATPAGQTLYIDTTPISFDGVLVTKALRIVGLGREQGVVTGTITINNSGYFACFENISFESPSSSALFSITGRGGLDFKQCRFLPGAGKYAFAWDATQGGTTYTPVAIELIQSYFQSGRMLNVLGTATRFFPIHAKEGCQIRFTENSCFELTNPNATAEFLQYEGQLDINPGLSTFGTTSRFNLVLRNVSISDQSNLCISSNLSKTDIVDCSIQVNSITRQSQAPSVIKGSGLTAAESMIRNAITSGTLSLVPETYGQDLIFIQNDVTLAGNVIYALPNPPAFDGQKVEVVFTGTHTLNGFTLNIFGLVTASRVTSVSPFIVTLFGYNNSWIARISGARSALFLQATGTQNAIPDTSGATLTQLETEVNSIKAALRNTSIIAT